MSFHSSHQTGRQTGPCLALAACILASACAEPVNESETATPPSPAVEGAPSGTGDTLAPPEQRMYAQTPGAGEELPPSLTTPGPIPLPYRAVWAIEAADCTAQPGLTRIAIAPGAVKFYEGRSEVTAVDARPDGTLVMNVSHEAEGEISTQTHELTLNAAADQLTYRRGQYTFVYGRCAN